MTIFYWALVRSLRRKFTLLVLVIAPLVLILIRPWWRTPESLGFSFYGLVLFFMAFLLVRAILTDRLTGTVLRIFAAPVTTLQYLAQNLLAFWVLLGAQIGVMVLLGVLRYAWEGRLAIQLFLCYILFTGTAIAFSLAWDSCFQTREMSDAVFSVALSVMSLLGGVFVPIKMLPAILQKIGMFFPTYWLASALISLQQSAAGDLWLAIVMLLLFAVVFLLFGSKRRLE